MHDPKVQATGAGASALEARIGRIRQNMATQQARLARATMLTAAIGAILCIAVAVWFYIGFTILRDFTTPSMIVQTAESMVIRSLPDARAKLTLQINESADEWAADISRQLQANIPEVRREFEEALVIKAGEAFDEFQVLSANEFRTFVQNNRPMLNDAPRSLKTQEEADRFVQDLHSAVELQLASDMRSQAEDMLHMLIDLNAKLDALAKGERMNQEQALEREILMISRRLQLENQANAPVDPSAAAAKRRARKSTSATAIATKAAEDQATVASGDTSDKD